MRKFLALLAVFISSSAIAQPDNHVPAMNPNGAGNVSIGAGSTVFDPLNALHIHRGTGYHNPDYPALRLTYKGTGDSPAGSKLTFGQLALQPSLTLVPVHTLSALTKEFDLVLRTGGSANPASETPGPRGNILISSQAPGVVVDPQNPQQNWRSIGFSTTPPTATTFPADQLRMVIAGNGNVGIGVQPFPLGSHIGTANPLDLLHIQKAPGSLAAMRISAAVEPRWNYGQLGMEGNSSSTVWEMTALGGNVGDLVLRNVNEASWITSPGPSGDLIITNQRRQSSIRFGTSPEVGPLTHGYPDVERMVINDRGNVIIGAPASDRAEKLNVHFNLAPGSTQTNPFAALRLSQADPDQGFSANDMYRNAVIGLAPFDDAWSDEAKKNDMVIGTNSGDLILANGTSGDEPAVTSGTQWNRIFAGAIRMMTRPSGQPGNPGHVERFTVLSNGKVGVNASNPITDFQVGERFSVHSGGTVYVGRNIFFDGTDDKRMETGTAGNLAFFANGDIQLSTINSGTTTDPLVRQNVLFTNTGLLSIGDIGSHYKLNVDGDVYLGQGGVENTKVRWDIWNSAEGHWIGYEAANPWWMTFASHEHEGFIFKTAGDGEIIKIWGQSAEDPDEVSNGDPKTTMQGRLYIGCNAAGESPTTSEYFRLAVNGSIKGKELVIDADDFEPWPDYVFSNDYSLLTIEELQKYIATFNRLPEMPSAEEVERDGFSVGLMQAKLLKKIEELSLYIIAQEQRIKQLEVKGQ